MDLDVVRNCTLVCPIKEGGLWEIQAKDGDLSSWAVQDRVHGLVYGLDRTVISSTGRRRHLDGLGMIRPLDPDRACGPERNPARRGRTQRCLAGPRPAWRVAASPRAKSMRILETLQKFMVIAGKNAIQLSLKRWVFRYLLDFLLYFLLKHPVLLDHQSYR
jgi:hypothetical protein